MAEKDHRRAKTTEETRAEAARLRQIWDRTENKPTQAEFGHRFGIGSQSAVALFLRGTTPLSAKAAAGFAAGLGCKVEDFSPRLATTIERLAENQLPGSDDFALVQRADVRVSAGHGQIVYEEGAKSALSFQRKFLKEIGVSPASAVVVTVRGHSMEPTIPDGAVLLVSIASTTITSGEVYAFRLGEELFVKRLHNTAHGVVAVSDNPDREAFPDLHVNGNSEEFELIGRALWFGARL